MGTKRNVSLVVWAVLAALAACEDGGPPNPFRRPSMRDAPNIAADGGAPDDQDSEDDAG